MSPTPLPPINIKAASELSGVSEHTLRAWENRYSAVSPSRSPTGRRIYTTEDIERLRTLGQLVNQGHTISVIAQLPLGTLESMIQKSEQLRGPRGEPHLNIQAGDYLDEMVELLKEYRLSELSELLSNARQKLNVREFALRLISPLMGEVGMLVARSQLNIAQEHALSAAVRDQLAFLLKELKVEPKRGKPRVAFATAEGDLHEFGILIGATLCGFHGISWHYLGANTPALDLAQAASGLRASVVVLGTSPIDPLHASDSLSDYLTELDRSLPSDCELWIGGLGRLTSATPAFEHPVRHLGTLDVLDRALMKLRS